MISTNKTLPASSVKAWLEEVLRVHGDLPFFLHDDYGESKIEHPIFEVAPPKSPDCFMREVSARLAKQHSKDSDWIEDNTYPERVRIMAKVDQNWLDMNIGESET